MFAVRHSGFLQTHSIHFGRFIFETIGNNPRIGHYRVKMTLNGRGRIIGHTTIWQIIRLFRDVKRKEKRERLKMPDEAPPEASCPHEIWFCGVRLEQAGSMFYLTRQQYHFYPVCNHTLMHNHFMKLVLFAD